jgi:Tol biopolymer transport system component
MRRFTPLAVVLLAAACQDSSPTSPTKVGVPAPSASRGTPPPIVNCGVRCERIVFTRDGLPESTGYTTIFAINPDGTGLQQIVSAAEQPTWSPNHQKVAFRRIAFANFGIGTINPDGTGLTAITTNTDDQDPKFSPDGTKIAFARKSSNGTFDLWIMNADGTQQTPVTFTNGWTEFQPDFSPDGKRLVYTTFENGNPDIGVLDIGTKKKAIIVSAIWNDMSPSWSPDGKRIAFQTGVSGPNTGCIAFVDPNGNNRTEFYAGGMLCSHPSWSPDGTQIAFRYSPNNLNTIAKAFVGAQVFSPVTATIYSDGAPAWAR